MGRKKNNATLDEISSFIQDNPGLKSGTIARYLGFDNKTVIRALPQLEDRGDMFLEDDQGHLAWFGKRK